MTAKSADPRAELRRLIASLPEARRRTDRALRADPAKSNRVGETFRRYAEADEAVAEAVRRIRELYELLGRP